MNNTKDMERVIDVHIFLKDVSDKFKELQLHSGSVFTNLSVNQAVKAFELHSMLYLFTDHFQEINCFEKSKFFLPLLPPPPPPPATSEFFKKCGNGSTNLHWVVSTEKKCKRVVKH